MNVNAYLHFRGDCAKALAFYEEVLGGKVTMSMRYGEAPAEMRGPPGSDELIMHARFELGGTVIMASDAPPGRGQKMAGCAISLNLDDPAAAERVYGRMIEGGAVHMAMAPTFWARRFAMFEDRFGVAWMINCE